MGPDPNTPEIPLDAQRRRLHILAWRRGFREIDLILGRFADQHLEGMTPARLEAFNRLLLRPDRDLYPWLVGAADIPPDDPDYKLLVEIRRFVETGGAVPARPADTGS